MKTSDYSTAKAILDGVDEVVAAAERTWGVGRLRLLVDDDLRARWDRQWLAWCRACEAYDLAAIRSHGAAVRRAVGVLEQAARAAGHEALKPDIWEVIHAARTKPFGYMAFYPGPGLGGHCIPIDPFYLTWKARQYGQSTRFIELAGEINTRMPEYVIDQLTLALNRRGKAVNGSKICVLGVAYKKDIDDLRESPSLTIIELLQNETSRFLLSGELRIRLQELGLEPVGSTPESLGEVKGEDVVAVVERSADSVRRIICGVIREESTR